MPVTTNYGIPTQDDPNVWNIVTDNAITANAVDLALLKVDTLRVGTGAQRTAFTTATNGLHWQDTDGQQLEYVRTGGVWVALGAKFYSGTGAQRVAFTTAPNGSQWQDTDGTKISYRRDGASWVSVGSADSGWVDLTSSLVSSYAGILEARKVGKNIEVRYGSLTKTVPAGFTVIGTLPAQWRPTSGGTVLVPRAAAYLDSAATTGSVQFNLNGQINVHNPTGTARSYVATSVMFFGDE